MSLGRYSFVNRIKGGEYYGTSEISTKIFNAVDKGIVESITITLTEGQRLDHIAGKIYNNSSMWWVIAASSGIGWGLQVPPGKLIKIPTNLDAVFNLL